MSGSALPGADEWEFLQSRKRTLPIAKVLPLSADGKTTDLSRPHDEPEPWEDDLLEKGPAMQLRLEVQLRANPLDYENKPFSEKTGDGVVDGKTTDGTPVNIKWIPPMGDGNTKQNSDHLMMNLKFWDLELPNMVLLVQGGHMHPYALVRGKMLADQRADFLKSRPRFNDSYFDGQRDPAQGWMAAGNAWRYPAFYVSPKYSEPEFTFRPSHTLFIDANLQVCTPVTTAAHPPTLCMRSLPYRSVARRSRTTARRSSSSRATTRSTSGSWTP